MRALRHRQRRLDRTTRAGSHRSCVDFALADSHLYSRVLSCDNLPHQGHSDHNLLLCTPAATQGTVPPPAASDTVAPRLRLRDDKRDDYVARPEGDASLSGLAQLGSAEAAAALASAIHAAAVGACSTPRAQQRGPAPSARPRGAGRASPWARRCRRAYFSLQDAYHRRLDAGGAPRPQRA
jgi:hypothetical protein